MSQENDIVAVGLDLEPETLIQCYSKGVFPWPSEGLPLLWYFPRRRGILEFKDFHLARRFKQSMRQCPWTFTTNQAFSQVMDHCSSRGSNEGTWILPEMKAAYKRLHSLGFAHSVEVWDNDELIGGLYGVDVAGYFAGESMFHRKTNASKAALAYAVALQRQAGRTWMDIQVLSPHLESLGAKEITRAAFKRLLAEAGNSHNAESRTSPFEKCTPVNYGAFSRSIE